ncbi:GNAT family N-acetyltransferase [Chitinibacter bivalviorum]|uniref:GNAT family N-acetyltransferase n=1 Tax=Chitinibacter bivalviorum TaxID=2739434 RepID=A0A7H9BMU7_9NEIS|nr:GNAT family N-acetyltransferase [Chitinibacter bivalviorum]QLG89411.1 GNAT family N-acetyltransferase [Chitinibacter bivalviorum]
MQNRFAIAKDADAIARLHVQSWQQTYRGTLSDHYLDELALAERRQIWRQRFSAPAANQRVWVACDGAQLLGFCCLYLAQDAQWGSYIDNLHVAAPAQGLGIGARLMVTAANCVQAEYGEQGLYLYCNQSNTSGQYFYQRRGGQVRGSEIWQAPDGSAIKALRFVWASATELIQ